MSTATYKILNSTGSRIVIEDSDNLLVAIDSTAIISLTDSQYQIATRIFGSANVILNDSESANPQYSYTPLGLYSLTLNDATAQPLAPPTGATTVQISVLNAPVNYRDDGVAPTSSVGIPANVGAQWFLTRSNLANVQFIAQTNANATVILSYYK